jgi:hypothetical protein
MPNFVDAHQGCDSRLPHVLLVTFLAHNLQNCHSVLVGCVLVALLERLCAKFCRFV